MAYGGSVSTYSSPSQLNAVSRRRASFAPKPEADRPSWDTSAPAPAQPDAAAGVGWTPQPAAGPVLNSIGGAGFAGGSSGDTLLDSMRNEASADAGGRIRGARLSASGSVGADPSLSAYAGLNALISGQGDAAHDVNRASLTYLMDEKKKRDQEALMRLQMQLQEELQRRMNSGSWLGDLGQLTGTLGGAWLGGPGGAALANRVLS